MSLFSGASAVDHTKDAVREGWSKMSWMSLYEKPASGLYELPCSSENAADVVVVVAAVEGGGEGTAVAVGIQSEIEH